jgi:tetratricopeptide (TPR) repeat protein
MSCGCGHRFDVSADQQGQEVPCPACGRKLLVPSSAGRVTLTSQRFLTTKADAELPAGPPSVSDDPGQLSTEEIREYAKRRAMRASVPYERTYAWSLIGTGIAMLAGGAILISLYWSSPVRGMWGGRFRGLLLVLALLIGGAGSLIKGIIDLVFSSLNAASKARTLAEASTPAPRQASPRNVWTIGIAGGAVVLSFAVAFWYLQRTEPPSSPSAAAPPSSASASTKDWEKLWEEGEAASKKGDLAAAENRFAAAVRAVEPLGEDEALAFSLVSLARVYTARANYLQADPLLRRALGIWEKTEDAEPDLVADCLSAIGDLCVAQGKYAEAESHYQREMAILSKAFGRNDLEVAPGLEDLGGLYLVQGKYADAEPLLRRALSIREANLDPDEPDLGSALHEMARLHHLQGKYAQAEKLFRRDLALCEKAQGVEHLTTSASLYSFGDHYRICGKYAAAEPLLQRSLTIREKYLGPDHPDVAASLGGLGHLYRVQGQATKAEPLLQKALAISEKALGPDHPDVAESLYGLGELYRA